MVRPTDHETAAIKKSLLLKQFVRGEAMPWEPHREAPGPLGGKGDMRGERGPETLVVFMGGSWGGKYRVDRFRIW